MPQLPETFTCGGGGLSVMGSPTPPLYHACKDLLILGSKLAVPKKGYGLGGQGWSRQILRFELAVCVSPKFGITAGKKNWIPKTKKKQDTSKTEKRLLGRKL